MSSSDIAISVRGLGKAYTIAHDQVQHITLAETILSRLSKPTGPAQEGNLLGIAEFGFRDQKG